MIAFEKAKDSLEGGLQVFMIKIRENKTTVQSILFLSTQKC